MIGIETLGALTGAGFACLSVAQIITLWKLSKLRQREGVWKAQETWLKNWAPLVEKAITENEGHSRARMAHVREHQQALSADVEGFRSSADENVKNIAGALGALSENDKSHKQAIVHLLGQQEKIKAQLNLLIRPNNYNSNLN